MTRLYPTPGGNHKPAPPIVAPGAACELWPYPGVWYTPSMAIVTIALPVTGIRGMLAGIKFSANRSGPYACGRTMAVNPGSIWQMWQRGNLSQAGRLWRTLTTVQQTAWETFAATPPETDYNSLGEVYEPSGFGWFTRIYLRLLRTGQANDLLAPASVPVDAPITFTLDLYPASGAGNQAVLGYTVDDFETHSAILKLALAPGVGTNVQTSRFLNCVEEVPGAGSSLNFGGQYHASFGITQVGMRFFGQLYRQSSTGIRSTPLELFEDVGAGP